MAKASEGARWLGSMRRVMAAVVLFVAPLLLLSPASYADGISPDDWVRTDHPTKEQCEAASSLAKESAAWGTLTGQSTRYFFCSASMRAFARVGKAQSGKRAR